jgi:hypothetical protein
MTSTNEDQARLEALMAGFTGTEAYYRLTLASWFVATDGVRAVAEAFKAFWLCDLVMSHTPAILKRNNFAVLRLEVREDRTALFTASDGHEEETVYARQAIPWTDFPRGVWSFYMALSELESGRKVAVMMVPNER